MTKTLGLPAILVIAGIACIMLAITGGISGEYVIFVPVEKRYILGGFGVLLFVLGIIPYISSQLNKITKGTKKAGEVDLGEAERIATEFIKGKVKGSKITISETKEESSIYKIVGTASSSSREKKYFTVDIDAKTKKVKDYKLEESPWNLTSSR